MKSIKKKLKVKKKQPNTFNLLNEVEDENSEINEIVEIQLISAIVRVKFSLLCKYSNLIREEYHINDARNNLSAIFQNYQNEFNIKEKSIVTFINFILEKDVELKCDEYCDLSVLSQFFKVNKLIQILKRYLRSNSEDIGLISNLIIEQNSSKSSYIITSDDICADMEEILIKNIEDCLQNDEFGKLPISTIYRIIVKSIEKVPTDLLYDFINESIEDRFALFNFIQIKDLSDDRLDHLLNEIEKKPTFYFDYIKNDFEYLKLIREDLLSKKELVSSLSDEKNQLKSIIDDLQEENSQLRDKKNQLEKMNDLLKKENNEFKSQFDQSQSHFLLLSNRLKKDKEDIKSKLNEYIESNEYYERESNFYLNLCKTIFPRIDLNKIMVSDKPLLHSACEIGNIDIVKYIISLNKVDINSTEIFKCHFLIAFQKFLF